MNRLEQVQALFFGALDVPPQERAHWLETCCTDLSVRQEAAVLLAAHRRMSLMEQSADSRAASRPTGEVPTNPFGAYRAVALLGQGGMSAVYRAERADGQFEQTVALKVMAAYLTGPEFLRRFETERRLLATLNHHNIARLLDGGLSSNGDPFLITEYIDGQTVDRYCDERRLGVEARLRICLQVCEAVDCAHRNLIVHRDLKPGNILVNAEGTVKLLDFGTAELLEARSDVTPTRVRMLTPRYASPEQLRGERVNIATDVFSLGVVLYELLTGAWPYGDPNSVLRELDRSLGDVAAKSPATVITDEAAGNRSATREQLRRALSGDLSAIVLKAIEYQPERRYESVRALAADLRNFLGGRPVAARPQTTLYRAGKFVRRRWVPVSAAAAFALGLSLAAIVAVHQTQTARAEAKKSENVVDFLSNMLSSGTRFGAGYTVAQMLDAAERELASNCCADPLTEARLRMNLGASYVSLQRPERAALQTERALALYRQHGDYRGAASALWVLGQNAQSTDSLRQAAGFYRQAEDILQQARKRNIPRVWDLRVERDLGILLARLSPRYLEEARTLLETGLADAAGDSSVPSVEIVLAQGHLVQVLFYEGKQPQAETAYRQAMSACSQTKVESDCEPALAGGMQQSGRNGDYVAASQFALRRYRSVVKDYGPENQWAVQCRLDWARYRAETGEISEAMAEVRSAMPAVRRHPLNESQWSLLLPASHVLARAGHFEEAEQLAREAFTVVESTQRDEVDWARAESLELIGTALAGEKKYREALPFLDRARAVYERLGPVFSRSLPRIQELLGKARQAARERSGGPTSDIGVMPEARRHSATTCVIFRRC
jgi:tetratricopeptide (TPR) repeat protein